MNRSVLIFDFDGTIADTHHHIVRLANRLAPEYNYDLIDWAEVDDLRDRTAQEIIRYLNVPLLKIPAILTRAKRELYADMTQIDPIDGLKDVLHRLKDLPVIMGILSSNASDNINRFLEHHGLKVFDFIHSTSRVWGKNVSLKKLLSQKGLTSDDVIYIGDEVRDINAAKKTGIRNVAVSWGYNSGKALEKAEPDYLISHPEELLQFALLS